MAGNIDIKIDRDSWVMFLNLLTAYEAEYFVPIHSGGDMGRVVISNGLFFGVCG